MSLVYFVINKLSPDFWCDPHSHHFWEIVYNVESDGKVLFGERELPYTGGSVLIHKPQAVHKCYNRGSTIHYCLGANGPLLDGLKEGVYESSEEVKSAFESFAEETNGKRPFYKELLELKTEEMVIFLRRLGPRDGEERGQDIPTGIRNMKSILDTDYRKKIDLTFLSDEVMLSVDYIRHEFKKHYGVSPIQYLINKRIEYAKHLLNTSNVSIKQIAYLCGFENEYYFSRIFKKIVGLSPTEQRTKAQGQLNTSFEKAP